MTMPDFSRMHAVRVKGKSTRGIRGVYVLIDEEVKEALNRLIHSRPNTSPASDYLFARYMVHKLLTSARETEDSRPWSKSMRLERFVA